MSFQSSSGKVSDWGAFEQEGTYITTGVVWMNKCGKEWKGRRNTLRDEQNTVDVTLAASNYYQMHCLSIFSQQKLVKKEASKTRNAV